MFLDQLESTLPKYASRDPHAPLALQGIRVVDLSHFLAGPFATMMLADMGADVIKVEAPGKGDEFRYYPPIDPQVSDLGGAFIWTNRNKRSIALDLKSEDGLKVVRELIATADVLIENFSTGVMERLGLSYEACAELNDRLVYCSVSAYGREGKFADRSGFDPVAQAESGYLDMNGYPDRDGVRSGAAVMDISTGAMASNAILGALIARHQSQKGQYVEVALFDTAFTMAGFAIMQCLLTGNVPGRHGNTSPDSSPSGLFHASDKSFIINCGTTKLFQRLFEAIGRPDIAEDPSFHARSERLARRDELFAILEDAFGKEPLAYWAPRLRQAGVPMGVVRNVAEAIESPEVRDRQLLSRIPHPVLGWLPNVAPPLRMSGTPVRDPVAPPSVGEHTDQILKEVLGYDDATIERLREKGALGSQHIAATV
jgi:crotonobetainyl-CoA:carnitine CoA-transferase CaiB-like acyl-CoA transferase